MSFLKNIGVPFMSKLLLPHLLKLTNRFSRTSILRSQKFILFIYVFSWFSTSCSIENLPISVDPAEQQIAVSSLIGPSETMFVALSRSFSALSVEDANDLTQDALNRLLLDHAFVTLEYEGFIDTLESVFDIQGLYGTQLQRFEDFQLMKLTVFDSTTSETISAESLLLPQVEVDSIIVSRRDTSLNFLTDFSYNILDPIGENFYVVQAYQFTDPDTSRTDSIQNDLFFSDGGFLIYEQLLTDRGAENGVIRKDDVIEFTSSIDSALVVITNVSEGYFNFLEARKRSGGILSSLANEPVNHPTNIKNGVGYFSAHRPWAVIIVVKEM